MHATAIDRWITSSLPDGRPIPGYRLIRRLGVGGHGEVWEAEGPGGFRLALKFVGLADGRGATELRSLEILKQIRHPNLLVTFGSWQVDRHLMIGMELADRTLWDRFLEALDGGLAGIPRTELLGDIGQAAEAIDYLNGHRHALGGCGAIGVQHRDVKPQNLLKIGGGLKVADFGLARLLAGNVASHTGRWTTTYAAPEFFRHETSNRSDQYSLAVTYCHLRCGLPPFSGSVATVITGHLWGEPELDRLPVEERPIVGRALSKVPDDRWPDCASFVRALREVSSPDNLPLPPALPGDPDDDTATGPPIDQLRSTSDTSDRSPRPDVRLGTLALAIGHDWPSSLPGLEPPSAELMMDSEGSISDLADPSESSTLELEPASEAEVPGAESDLRPGPTWVPGTGRRVALLVGVAFLVIAGLDLFSGESRPSIALARVFASATNPAPEPPPVRIDPPPPPPLAVQEAPTESIPPSPGVVGPDQPAEGIEIRPASDLEPTPILPVASEPAVGESSDVGPPLGPPIVPDSVADVPTDGESSDLEPPLTPPVVRDSVADVPTVKETSDDGPPPSPPVVPVADLPAEIDLKGAGPPAPMRLEIPADVTIPAGGEGRVLVRLPGGTHADAPVLVRFEGVPGGVEVREATIPAGRDRVGVEVKAGPSALPGRWPLEAVASVGSARISADCTLIVESGRPTDGYKSDWRTQGPPADPPAETIGPAPGPGHFFVPGHFAPLGDEIVWKMGFWAPIHLGWDWIPARWVRRPEGWAFLDGRWARVGTTSPDGSDRDPATTTRHVVARPAASGPPIAVPRRPPANRPPAPTAARENPRRPGGLGIPQAILRNAFRPPWK